MQLEIVWVIRLSNITSGAIPIQLLRSVRGGMVRRKASILKIVQSEMDMHFIFSFQNSNEGLISVKKKNKENQL